MVKCNKCGVQSANADEGYSHVLTSSGARAGEACGGAFQRIKEDRHTRLKCSGCKLLVNAKFGIELMGGPHGCGGTWEPYAGQGVPYSEAAALADDVADGPVASFARRVAKAGGQQAGLTYCNKCGYVGGHEGYMHMGTPEKPCGGTTMAFVANEQQASAMAQQAFKEEPAGIGLQTFESEVRKRAQRGITYCNYCGESHPDHPPTVAKEIWAANQQQYQDSPTMVLSGLRRRIEELEKERDDFEQGCILLRAEANRLQVSAARANRLSDECGALKNENTQLLAENARLRRGGR